MVFIYIIRLFWKPVVNPLLIENVPIFLEFTKALEYVTEYMEIHQLQPKENIFDHQNRYYLYEDFIAEHFIWIEKHEINIL